MLADFLGQLILPCILFAPLILTQLWDRVRRRP